MNRRAALRAMSGVSLIALTGCNAERATVAPAAARTAAPPGLQTPATIGAANMTPDKAYALYLAWKKHIGEVRKAAFTGFRLASDGSYEAIHGAADFSYNYLDKKLMVMRVLLGVGGTLWSYQTVGIVADRKLAETEPYTLGGGEIYINNKPWLDATDKSINPNGNTYCLKRDFTNANIANEQFINEVEMLIYWAEYWQPRGGTPPAGFKESGAKRAWKTPEEQAATRPALEKFAREINAKSRPPVVKSLY